MEKIGGRLREERNRLGLSQTDFGAAGGVKLGAQHAYEAGKRSPDAEYFASLALAGVDVEYVITGQRRGASSSGMAEAGRASWDEARFVSAVRTLSTHDRAAIMQIVESLRAR